MPDGQASIVIDVNVANLAANQSIQFLAERSVLLHDWNGDGIISIINNCCSCCDNNQAPSSSLSNYDDNGLFLLFSNDVGYDDGEVRTGNAMIFDPYGEILAETSKAANDMVVADLVASLQPLSSGRRWLKARRPELYDRLTAPTGEEQDARTVRFGKKGIDRKL